MAVSCGHACRSGICRNAVQIVLPTGGRSASSVIVMLTKESSFESLSLPTILLFDRASVNHFLHTCAFIAKRDITGTLRGGVRQAAMSFSLRFEETLAELAVRQAYQSVSRADHRPARDPSVESVARNPLGSCCQIPPSARYLISRYSSIPYFDPSRPMPDCLTPPNGAASFASAGVFTPTIPASSASPTRKTRPMSRA
jgi:hypothetical protein